MLASSVVLFEKQNKKLLARRAGGEPREEYAATTLTPITMAPTPAAAIATPTTRRPIRAVTRRSCPIARRPAVTMAVPTPMSTDPNVNRAGPHGNSFLYDAVWWRFCCIFIRRVWGPFANDNAFGHATCQRDQCQQQKIFFMSTLRRNDDASVAEVHLKSVTTAS